MREKADFEALCASDPRPALLVDVTGRLTARNGAARRSIAGLVLAERLPQEGGPKLLDQYLRRCSRTREPQLGVLTFRTHEGQAMAWRSDGGLAWPATDDRPTLIALRLRPRADANAAFVSLKGKYNLLNAELHRRALIQAELETALRVKDVLLSEINHRVKNNLQVITSMLAMGAHGEQDVRVRQKLEQTAARVRAIGTVQALLYQSVEVKDVDCALLVQNLVANVARVFDRPEIELTAECTGVRLDADRAISVALITNELVANAFKHAFPGGRRGSIKVRLVCEGHYVTLTVIDDGIPFAAEPTTRSGSGMKIVRALASKLEGEFGISTVGSSKVVAVGFTTN